jgi:hypothetical protein
MSFKRHNFFSSLVPVIGLHNYFFAFSSITKLKFHTQPYVD